MPQQAKRTSVGGSDHTASRRQFLWLPAGLCATSCVPPAAAPDASNDEFFASVEATLGGRLGVYALNTHSHRALSFRGDERFAMCSTFKWALVATLLQQVDEGVVALSEKLPFGERDLLEYAPVTRERLKEGALSLEDLCAAAITVSDNTAANLVLAKLGGPAAVTAFLRAGGDDVTRLDRSEPTLNENASGDPRDTTSPRAMVQSLRRVALGDVLSPASRARLLGWLEESPTGRSRLRAGLPKDYRAGDKTGSCSNAAVNDVAITWPPGRSPILIAVYTSGGTAQMNDFNEAHASIARHVVREFSR